jgi:hypothetical protein
METDMMSILNQKVRKWFGNCTAKHHGIFEEMFEFTCSIPTRLIEGCEMNCFAMALFQSHHLLCFIPNHLCDSAERHFHCHEQVLK